MKRFKKILALCAIVVLAIAAIFAVPACRYNSEVERITVEINGGGEVVELAQKDATIENIMDGITVIAELNDETTQTITDYTVEDFDATKLDVVQTVTVKYGEFTATVPVKVNGATVTPQVTSIEVTYTGNKVTMKKAEASEQALRKLLTVKAVKSDNSKETVTNYTVTGFDASKVNVDQTVTIKYGTFSKTVKVQVTEETPVPQVTKIEVTVNSGEAKVTMKKAEASEQALRSALTVKAVKSDNSKAVITDYIIEGLDLVKTNADQTVTIKYGENGKFTATVKVLITEETPVVPQVVSIKATVSGGKITLTEDNATEAAILAKVTVTATYDDKTTKIVTEGLTVVGFDAAKLDEVQTVNIKYGEFSANVSVIVKSTPVIPPQITSIEVSIDGDKITLEKANATDAAILAKVTVTAKYDNNTTKPVTEGLTVVDFDAAKVNVDQTVTIKYGEFSDTVTVFVTEETPVVPQIVSIEVSIDGDKITLQKANATEAAILAQVTVTAKYDNNTTKPVTEGLTVVDFDAAKVNVDQTVTIKYGEFSDTVTVFVTEETPVVPHVVSLEAIFEGDVLTMEKEDASEQTLRGLLTVKAVMSDGSKKEITDYEIEGLDLELVDDDQTVTIKYGDDIKTYVTVFIKDESEPDTNGVYIIINDRAPVKLPENAATPGEYMLQGYSLTAGDTVVFKHDGEVVEYKKACKFKGTVHLSGNYDFYVKVAGDDLGIWVTDWVQVSVLSGGDTRIVKEINYDATGMEEKYQSQFIAVEKLIAGDKVTVKDIGGNTLKYEDKTVFNGTALNNGTYTFTIKLGYVSTDDIVSVKFKPDNPTPTPDKGAYIIINGGEPVELEVNPGNTTEYMLQGQPLEAGDTVAFTYDGKPVAYKADCKFDGTVYLTGNYDFYVTPSGASKGVWVTDWVQVSVKSGETTRIVEEIDYDLTGLDKNYESQFIAVAKLLVGDIVTVMDIGGNVIAYGNTTVFNGTATKDGTYTFNIKLAGWHDATDVVSTKYAAPAVESLSVTFKTGFEVDNGVLVLYGAQKDSLKAALTVTAKFDVGADKVIANADYTTNFSSTTLNEVQTVKITYGGKSENISVKAVAAKVTGITVEYKDGATQVELVGKKATIANIKDKITVTAAYNDGTTKEVNKQNYTVTESTFDSTSAKYGQTQEVEISFGEKNATVNVKVIAPTAVKLEADMQSVDVIITHENETKAEIIEAIKNTLTVTVTMNDDTVFENDKNYEVELADDFDVTDFDNAQTAKITSRGKTVEIEVQLKKQPVSMAVTLKGSAVSISERLTGNAKITALKEKITVTLTYSDESTDTTTGYGVTFGELNTTTYKQTATISYTGLDSQTVEVTILAVPKITVGDDTKFMTADSADANRYLSGNVELSRGDTVVITYRGAQVAFGNNFNGTAALDGVYTFTVSVAGNTASVVTTVPEYKATLKVNGVEKTATEENTWTLALKVGNKVTVSDNKFDGEEEYIAPYNGDYTFTVNPDADDRNFVVEAPEYTVTMKVTRGGAVVDTKTLTKGEGQTYSVNVTLQKNDTVAITDNAGKTFDGYAAAGEFKGTAPRNGVYKFRVIISGSGHSVEVEVPAKVTLTYGSEFVNLVRNYDENEPTKDEYMITGLALTAGQTVEIKVEGVKQTNYKPACKFNGTVYLTGNYNFYVRLDDGDKGIWVAADVERQVLIERNGKNLDPITPELDKPTDLGTQFKQQYKATAQLLVGDKVSIKDIGGNVFKYENKDFFNGTAATNGTYTFYIKLGKDSKDDIVYVGYAAAALQKITVTAKDGFEVDDNEVLTLYGVQADNLKAALTVKATYDVQAADTVIANYTVSGYDKDTEGVQTVTVSYTVNKVAKTDTIKVKVLDAYVTEITAAYNETGATSIELVGIQATEANILAAISVTATYNDGTTEQDVEATVVASSFDATGAKYGQTQEVTISFGGKTTTVNVKVIAPTALTITLNKNTVDVLNDNTVSEPDDIIPVIRKTLKTTVTMDDGYVCESFDHYEVTIPAGFDILNFESGQQVTITAHGLNATLTVQMTRKAESIAYKVNDGATLEFFDTLNVVDKEAALRTRITVTLSYSAGNPKTTEGYEVEFGALTADYKQTATISYEGVEESKTLTLTIVPVPRISIKGATATPMTANEGKYPSGDIELKRGEQVAITYAGKTLTVSGGNGAIENGTAKLNGTYAFEVTPDGLNATVTCTKAPTYAVTLKVDGTAATQAPAVTGNSYTWTLTLSKDNIITVSDNKFGNLNIGTSSQYKAPYNGQYTFTFTNGDTKSAVTVQSAPEYTVTMKITSGETETTKTLTKVEGESEYTVSVNLLKGDTVAITDNEGTTFNAYAANGEFKGTAPRDGTYTFRVIIDGDGHSIAVTVPAKVVSITYGSTTVNLDRNAAKPQIEEYKTAAGGLALTAGQTVVVKVDGDVKSNYKANCKFDGNVYLTGNYDFYIQLDGDDQGIWVTDWVQVTVQSGASTRDASTEYNVNGLAEKYRSRFIAVEKLFAGDQVTVRDIGNNVLNYENATVFNGTAANDGTYTFRINLGKNNDDDIISVDYRAPQVEKVTVSFKNGFTVVDKVLNLYGVQANDLDAALTVKATYDVQTSDTVVDKTDYTVSGYDKSKRDTVQTVTVAYGGESATISVKVLAATVTGITAAYKAEGATSIELIGANATVANILDAISVTATYNDGTTKQTTAAEVTTSTFDASEAKYGQTQEVEISFGGKTTKVNVKVVAPTAVSIELSQNSIDVVNDNTISEAKDVSDYIEERLTVTVTMNDGTTRTDYEVKLPNNFDVEKFGENQSVTIESNGLTATLTVRMTRKAESITVTAKAGAGAEISISEAESNKITALRNLITVTLNYSAGEPVETDGYTVTFGALDTTTYKQTATISYTGVESATVEVTIVPVPKISAKGAAATFMTADADSANKYPSGDIQLTRGQKVVITYKGSELTVSDANGAIVNGTAKLNGTYAFTVTVDGATATVACTKAPAYAATLKVGNDVKQPTSANTWTLTLSKGDKVTVSDNKFGDLTIEGEDEYVATRTGEYTFTVTTDDTKSEVAVTAPAYSITMTITSGETETSETLTLDNANKPSGALSKYTASVTLNKGDTVAITDNEGKKFTSYATDGEFKGTAPRNGNYDFSLTIYSSSHLIAVDVPDMVVSITYGETTVNLRRNEGNKQNVEYRTNTATGVTLTAGQTVVVKVDGDVKSNYKADCRFNGTVYLTGKYNISVIVDGSAQDGIMVTYFAQATVEHGGEPTVVGFELDNPDNLGANFKQQYKAVVKAVAGDKITVKDISGKTLGYDNDTASEFGNGTVTADGTYTIYIKLGKDKANDIISVEYTEPQVTEITVSFKNTYEVAEDGTLILYGTQADNLNAALTVTAKYDVGADGEVTNYTVEGFDKDTLNTVQTVTVACGGEDTEISVKVLAAKVTAISAAYKAEGATSINLTGVNATAANILAAITVTATYNDGTTVQNVAATVVPASFSATTYGEQTVTISFGGKTTAVKVTVIKATPSSLEVLPATVEVKGANETEVINAIKAAITSVKVVMDDGEKVTAIKANCTVTLGEFDYHNFTTAQDVTIGYTYEGSPLTATLPVQLIKAAKSIAPNQSTFTISETVAGEDARLQALKDAGLKITLTYTDDSTANVSTYTVDFEGFSASKFTAQTVTISYPGVEDITIQVTVKSVPKIIVNNGAAKFMTVDPDNENRYLSGDVELKSNQTVEIRYNGAAVSLGDNFNGTAVFEGTYTFAVTVDGTNASVVTTVPEYKVTLSVGGVASEQQPVKEDGVYKFTVTLKINDIVTLADNKPGTPTINGKTSYKATRSGDHVITVTPGADNAVATATATQPEYAVTLTITGGKTIALEVNTASDIQNGTEYFATGVTLQKNDTVTITDNEGNTYSAYDEDCGFSGKASIGGRNYAFYVKIYTDSTKNSIWVTVPSKITLTVGDVTYNLTLDTNKNEYFITRVKLPANTAFIIENEGVAVTQSAYQSNSPFKGTSEEKGYYDFYVGSAGNNIWVQLTAEPIRIYFHKDSDIDWWFDVYAYCYLNDDNKNATWPGVQMKWAGNNWYYLDISKEAYKNYTSIIFNNGSGGGTNQSGTFTFNVDSVDDDLCIYYTTSGVTTTDRP
ncbi:MAG: starch-binding protein [Clostridia bacterium]|nr:starch-binding protein [Clostridia bacterium]